jgi:membrane protein
MPDTARISQTEAPVQTQARSLIIQPGLIAREFWLLRRALVAAYEDNCFGIAKGAAYSFLLSLFPILTTLTAILLQVRAQAVVHVIYTFVAQIVPPETEELILSRLQEHGTKPIGVPVFSVFLSIWAGSGAMLSLMEGFQAAYRIPSGRPFLKQRAMAVFLVLIAALPAVGASSLIIFGNHSEAAFIHWIGVSTQGDTIGAPIRMLWRVGRYLVAFGTTTFVTGLLYYFGPNHRPEQRRQDGVARPRFVRVWPGAFLSTVLWLLATAGFSWYVGHVAHYNIFYGSLVSAIVLLVWLYLIAVIAMIGCEFNAERERIHAMPFRTSDAK